MCWKCKRQNPYIHECPQKHKIDKILLENLEKCSKCLKNTFFVHFCVCNYKLCKDCFDYNAQKVLTCPVNHELKFFDKPKRRSSTIDHKKIITESVNVFCDSCDLNIQDIKNGYYTCDQLCDYDICISCVQSAFDDENRSNESYESYGRHEDYYIY